MIERTRCVVFAGLIFVQCGGGNQVAGDGGLDAGGDDATADAATSDASDGGLSFGDGGLSDASCGFGSAGSFATQASLNLFGQTVFFVDGGALPPGHYRIAYVDGCMKYNANQDWTVNAYSADASTGHWWLVNGPGGQAGTAEILTPPGTIGYLVQNGAYATFTACVNANVQLDAPKEFDFDGGALGLWLADSPYSDNVAGNNGRNPKWGLTLVGQPCPQ